jgi:hypothetical protein
MRKVAFVAASCSLLFLAAPAAADPTLQINGSGQLTGATGVVVDGSVYDVTFVDNTCAGTFGDCTNSSNFNFTTFDGAYDAAQALLDTVFVDSGSNLFDSNPGLTLGCSDPDNCFVTIPYETFNGGFYANEAWNTSGSTDFNNVSLTVTGDFDSRNYDDHVYAFFDYVGPFAAVPEPASWTLMLLGFGAIGLLVRRTRRLAAA